MIVFENKPSTKTPINDKNLNENFSELNAKFMKNINIVETDLNDYVESGVYYFSADYTPKNIPVGVNGWLYVLNSDSGGIKQIWYRQGTIGSNDYHTFLRTKNTLGNWSNWKLLLTEDDIFYKNGDIIEIGYHTVGGSITSSSKDLQFSIVVPKSLKNIKSFTINSLHITARGINGYITGINGNSIYVSDSDISYNNSSIATENILNIRLARNEVFGNVTNNTPVSIAINSAKITFNE